MRWVGRNLKCSLAITVGALAAGTAPAAVVIDPFPRIQPGFTVGIRNFVQTSATAAGSTGVPSTAIQSLQPVRDGSGRLFVNDTRGILWVTTKAGGTPTQYIDLNTLGIGFSNAAQPTQTGLMGFAFHPNFGRDPSAPGYATFYTVDTAAASARAPTGATSGTVNHDNIVHEWTVADPAAAAASIVAGREVMRVTQPFADHGPGTIGFNPTAAPGTADYGKLYIGFGDGGGVNDPRDNAQNLASPFGKILRIDPTDPDGPGGAAYGVPADNPFVGQAGARGDVWAYGLRNPQHFSWDQATGQMLIADIGQAEIEEVNVGVGGANYGWPLREGTFARSLDKAITSIFDTPANPGLYLDPIGQYDHEEIAFGGQPLAGIGGAYRYRGALMPMLDGMILLSDLVSGRLFYFSPDEAAASGMPAILRELLLTYDGASATFLGLEGYGYNGGRVDLRWGIDADGELYLVSKRDGDIYAFLDGVPEPSAWAMLLIGFGAVGTALRRRAPLQRAARRRLSAATQEARSMSSPLGRRASR